MEVRQTSRNTLFVSNALLISTYILTKGSNPTLETTYSC